MGQSHGLILMSTGALYGQGENANNQYSSKGGVSTTPSQINTSAFTSDEVLQIGAIRNMSFIVTKSAVFVSGQCEFGLCGQDSSL